MIEQRKSGDIEHKTRNFKRRIALNCILSTLQSLRMRSDCNVAKHVILRNCETCYTSVQRANTLIKGTRIGVCVSEQLDHKIIYKRAQTQNVLTKNVANVAASTARRAARLYVRGNLPIISSCTVSW